MGGAVSGSGSGRAKGGNGGRGGSEGGRTTGGGGGKNGAGGSEFCKSWLGSPKNFDGSPGVGFKLGTGGRSVNRSCNWIGAI